MVNSYHECRFKELFLYSLQALVKQSTEAAYFPRFFVTSSITKIQYINITQLNRVFRDYEDTMSNVSVYSIFCRMMKFISHSGTCLRKQHRCHSSPYSTTWIYSYTCSKSRLSFFALDTRTRDTHFCNFFAQNEVLSSSYGVENTVCSLFQEFLMFYLLYSNWETFQCKSYCFRVEPEISCAV